MQNEYDYADRLVGMVGLDSGTGTLSLLASYTYDALGRRVSKTFYSGGVPTGTNLFLYDGSSVIEERENSAGIQSFVHVSGLTTCHTSWTDFCAHPSHPYIRRTR